MRLRPVLLLALVACAHASTVPPLSAPSAPVELVESAPVETTLDHADIADAWQVWPGMLSAARESIDLNEFYLSNEPGSRLDPSVDALLAALQRGVRVRVLAEEKFYKTYPETIERLAKAGAKVRRFDAKAIFGGGVLHAKYFVIDRRDAYLGSQNFDWRSLEHIQELGIRTAAKQVVDGLTNTFELDWAAAGGEPAPKAEAVVQHDDLIFAASPDASLPAGVPWDLPLLVERIRHAKSSVRVQLLTYKAGNEFRELEDALIDAASRGVKVQLLLSHWVLRKWTLAPLREIDRGIEVRILTIPESSKGHIPFARTVHAKYMVVDGERAWVGTSNWERDYFLYSRNVGVFIEGGALPKRLDAFFADGWNSPYTKPFDRNGHYVSPKTD